MVYIAFVDLLKAFDNVNLKVMMKILRMIKIGYRDRRIIRVIQTSNDIYKRKETKKEAAVRKGVRQGYNISPLLCNVYREQVIHDCKEYCTGIKMNGVRIQMPRFADDTAILAQGEVN